MARGKPAGYLQAWSRIWNRDYCELIQLAVRAGLELRASELQVQRSNHLATLPPGHSYRNVTKISRRNPPENWAILIFSGQKSCTRIIYSILHSSFLPFLKAIDVLRWKPEKIKIKFHKMTSWLCMNFFRILPVFSQFL